jgi:hypothetical protein
MKQRTFNVSREKSISAKLWLSFSFLLFVSGFRLLLNTSFTPLTLDFDVSGDFSPWARLSDLFKVYFSCFPFALPSFCPPLKASSGQGNVVGCASSSREMSLPLCPTSFDGTLNRSECTGIDNFDASKEDKQAAIKFMERKLLLAEKLLIALASLPEPAAVKNGQSLLLFTTDSANILVRSKPARFESV